MKLTDEKIKTNTHFSKMHYENLKRNLENYENDGKKEYRLNQLLCRTCFYLKSGIAGQAFTDYECNNCGTKKSYPNTNTPSYCDDCAKKHNCCVRCASKL